MKTQSVTYVSVVMEGPRRAICELPESPRYGLSFEVLGFVTLRPHTAQATQGPDDIGGTPGPMARYGKAVLSGVFIAAVGLCLSPTAAGRRLEEDIGLRWLFTVRGPAVPPLDVLIVSIDRTSSEQLGVDTERWPPSRHVHADVVRSLTKHGASAIVMDIFFRVPRSAAEDADLADAIVRSGRVALFESVNRQVLSGDEIVETRAPIEPLRNAAIAIGAFPLPDRQLVHFFWTFFDAVDGQTPTLPAVALQIHGLPVLDRLESLLGRAGVTGLASLPRPIASAADSRAVMRALRHELGNNAAVTERARALIEDENDRSLTARERRLLKALVGLYSGSDRRYLNYYGPPGHIRTIPVNELLRNDPRRALDLKDKVVFVGESLPALVRNSDQGDTFHTVYSAADGVDLSGPEIAATAFANLLTDRGLRRVGPVAEAAILTGIGLLMGLVLRLAPGPIAVALTLAATGAYSAMAQYQFGADARLFPIAVPLLVQLPLGLVVGLLWRYLTVRRQVAREIDQGVAAQVVQGVCLSTDVEGYTAVSQLTEPRALASLMSEYFSMLARLVTSHDGLMLGRAGDGAMCVWAPSNGWWRLARLFPGGETGRALARQRTRAKACQAALDVKHAIDEFNRQHSPHLLTTRIGLHAGDLALGPVGGEFHVVGDTPNVASRVQALNKQLKTTVLASEAVVASLDGLCVRPMGAFELKGRSGEVTVFEIMGRTGQIERATLDLCDRFARALEHVAAGQWLEATAKFRQIALDHPSDGPTRYYQALCADRAAGDTPSGRSPSVIVTAAIVAVSGVLSLGVSPAAAACREPTARIVSIDRTGTGEGSLDQRLCAGQPERTDLPWRLHPGRPVQPRDHRLCGQRHSIDHRAEHRVGGPAGQRHESHCHRSDQGRHSLLHPPAAVARDPHAVRQCRRRRHRVPGPRRGRQRDGCRTRRHGVHGEQPRRVDVGCRASWPRIQGAGAAARRCSTSRRGAMGALLRASSSQRLARRAGGGPVERERRAVPPSPGERAARRWSSGRGERRDRGGEEA